jgi:hypothetical protein
MPIFTVDEEAALRQQQKVAECIKKAFDAGDKADKAKTSRVYERE